MILPMISSPKDVGFWVETSLGLISVFQCLTVFGWVAYSERAGRKLATITALVVTAASLVVFGVSPSLVWCLGSCCLLGLGLGNVSLLRFVSGSTSMGNDKHEGNADA